MSIRQLLSGVVALVSALPSAAQDISLHGYLDYRAVAASGTRGFVDGGLSKTRFGDAADTLEFGGIALQLDWLPRPDLLGVLSLQAQDTDESTLDALEAYVRYRPASTTPWRWSTTLGMFFPPLSLENDGVAWTTRRTLTPSAINSWVGEELRIIGTEVRLEHRGERGTLSGALAAYVANDPTGELLAARGWSLSDLYYGLGSTVREPDNLDDDPPYRYDPFVEIDDRIGWYAALSWDAPAWGRIELIGYDNRADPATFVLEAPNHEVFTWRTYFWGLGAQTRVAEVELTAQVLRGMTQIQPSPTFFTETEFNAGYLLASHERGTLIGSARIDFFQTRQLPESLSTPANEHGHALTLALNWRALEWLRLSAEWLRIDSSRTSRVELGEPERVIESQLQVSARVLF